MVGVAFAAGLALGYLLFGPNPSKAVRELEDLRTYERVKRQLASTHGGESPRPVEEGS